MMVVLKQKQPKLSIAIVIVKMIMFVVTQLLVNVFFKQHFSCGCCQKGLDISGAKCMCKVSYGDSYIVP